MKTNWTARHAPHPINRNNWAVDSETKRGIFHGTESEARLIAAAPELLEALQAIVTDHDAETGRYMAKELRAHTRERLMNDARAAIAKATQP